MSKYTVVENVEIPEELGDTLKRILDEAILRMRKGGVTPRYGLILEPLAHDDTHVIEEARFTVLDEPDMRGIQEYIKKNVRGKAVFASKLKNLRIPEGKGLHDYGEPPYFGMIMPDVYIDGEDIMFTTEYEND